MVDKSRSGSLLALRIEEDGLSIFDAEDDKAKASHVQLSVSLCDLATSPVSVELFIINDSIPYNHCRNLNGN